MAIRKDKNDPRGYINRLYILSDQGRMSSACDDYKVIVSLRSKMAYEWMDTEYGQWFKRQCY